MPKSSRPFASEPHWTVAEVRGAQTAQRRSGLSPCTRAERAGCSACTPDGGAGPQHGARPHAHHASRTVGRL